MAALRPSRALTALSWVALSCVPKVPAAPYPTEPPDSGDYEAPPTARADDEDWVKAAFDVQQLRVPMRDGTTLYTRVLTPKRSGPDDDRTYPILMIRTPYSCAPYEEGAYPNSVRLDRDFAESGYIHVCQDVRGRFMSDGTFVNMTPHIDEKKGPQDIDESSDTYDTVDWLVKNVPHNNGKVGQWGISYPGFYAAAAVIEAHPALVAVSPQAPIADWFFDDFHHHGAFFLPHLFNFISVFGQVHEGRFTEWGERFDHGTKDGFMFFQELGPLKNANDRYFHHEIPFWDAVVAHPNYDEFWQKRNLLPHLKNVSPAVMTVGGWFDAEDLYGPLKIYRAIEKENPGAKNMLVMGPWRHGGWNRTPGDKLGNVGFGGETAVHYQKEIQRRFFDHYLKGEGDMTLPEASVFETGRDVWRAFDQWPPAEAQTESLWFAADGKLVSEAPTARRAYDEFVSDPAKPVPFTEDVNKGMTREYMTDDQRFAARRPDVLTWTSPPLQEPVTMAGPLMAALWVSTSQQDADWVVKLVDIYPKDAETPEWVRPGMEMGNYHQMVRSEIIRGRFRESYENPKPFVPNQATEVNLELQDVLHTFMPGHQIQIQIQSTWFPLVDLNPQKWVDNIFEANEDDFVSAKHRVYRQNGKASRVTFGRLKE